jgi:hypothetical protein
MSRRTKWSMGRTTRVASDACPACGTINDAATPIGSRGGPSPGDVGVCLGCASVVVYDKNLKLRRPTGKEMREFAKDERVTMARAAVRELLKVK